MDIRPPHWLRRAVTSGGSGRLYGTATQGQADRVDLDPEIFLSTKYNTPKRMTHFTTAAHLRCIPHISPVRHVNNGSFGRSLQPVGERQPPQGIHHPSKGVIRQKTSPVRGHHPSRGIIHQKASSIKRRHPTELTRSRRCASSQKELFHLSSPSIPPSSSSAGFPSAAASSHARTARSTALAFSAISSHSPAGSLSAVIAPGVWGLGFRV